ncbi:hypothetical protein CCUS01_12897 [Colletotrichum cuscutae]|uniref:Uncharacterized protein n=1 Tax=Colletotrichum cuscutae TaxID=1209917 RepID=A0AAI9YD68_9PEZI|nr:hypothetical protein CCUS01_12897 [Colletotrichum cuscutae]
MGEGKSQKETFDDTGGKKGGLRVSRRSFLSRPRRLTRNAVEFRNPVLLDNSRDTELDPLS